MEVLSPLLQYTNIEMSEEEILELRTAWFQFARDGDALFLRYFPGASLDEATLPPVETKLLKNGHADSFELLSPEVAKCRNQVYWFGAARKKIHAESFRLIQRFITNTSSRDYPVGMTHWVWSADENNVYRYDTVKKGLHGGSFERLDGYWARDRENIFCFLTQKIYRNIDVTSFRTLGNGKAEDQGFTYTLVPNPNAMPEDSLLVDCFADPSFAILKKTRRT